MTGQQWNRNILALVVAALICAVAAVSISFAYPTQVASPTLGVEWQCHRTVGILTTCSRVSHVVPMKNPSKPRATDIRKV
jgi:hypothetical protein